MSALLEGACLLEAGERAAYRQSAEQREELRLAGFERQGRNSIAHARDGPPARMRERRRQREGEVS